MFDMPEKRGWMDGWMDGWIRPNWGGNLLEGLLPNCCALKVNLTQGTHGFFYGSTRKRLGQTTEPQGWIVAVPPLERLESSTGWLGIRWVLARIAAESPLFRLWIDKREKENT